MITDDELLLYYYRDGLEPDERARIGAALAGQPDLARRLHKLVARLDAVATGRPVDVPEKFRQRWAAALDTASRVASRATPVRPSRSSLPLLLSAAAVLAVVVFAVAFQFRGVPPGARSEPLTVENPAPARGTGPSSYEAGLKVHLASTEQQIASLRDATPEERAKLIDTIIGQNQMFALAAERAGEPQLARVLRAFTPILEDVASGRTRSANGDLAQLGFEMRVMQARLGAGARTPTTL